MGEVREIIHTCFDVFIFISFFFVKLHVAISLLVSPPLSLVISPLPLLISPLSLLASFGNFLSPIAAVLPMSYVRQTHSMHGEGAEEGGEEGEQRGETKECILLFSAIHHQLRSTNETLLIA